MLRIEDVKLAVVGLGYVGLPLAVEFGKKRDVLGFDINVQRVAELQGGRDHTLEVSPEELAEAGGLRFSSDAETLGQANVYIVTVPTPIDAHKQPDLTPLLRASESANDSSSTSSAGGSCSRPVALRRDSAESVL